MLRRSAVYYNFPVCKGSAGLRDMATSSELRSPEPRTLTCLQFRGALRCPRAHLDLRTSTQVLLRTTH